MKGRKPKYPQQDINNVAARLAAGESPSALAQEMGWPRTSILRCADSVRAPAQVTENAKQTIKDKNSIRRDRLFWRFVEANLRQGILKSKQAAPKEIAAMLESAVKLKALMSSSAAGSRTSTTRLTAETVGIFDQFFKRATLEVQQMETPPEESLAGAKADALESRPIGEPGGGPDPKEAA